MPDLRDCGLQNYLQHIKYAISDKIHIDCLKYILIGLQNMFLKLIEEKWTDWKWIILFLQETFQKELKPMDHGYTSIIELCSALPEVIRMERPHSKGDWRLLDKRLPSPAKPGTDKRMDALWLVLYRASKIQWDWSVLYFYVQIKACVRYLSCG